jgi:ABC-2 type transport system ATP-binding protein
VAIFRSKILRLGTPRDLERVVVRRRLAVRMAGDPSPYVDALRALPVSQGVEIAEGELIVQLDDIDRDAPAVVRSLVLAGAEIQRVAGLDSALEAAYLSIIGESQTTLGEAKA